MNREFVYFTDVKNIPGTDLATIERLWNQFSGGKFVEVVMVAMVAGDTLGTREITLCDDPTARTKWLMMLPFISFSVDRDEILLMMGRFCFDDVHFMMISSHEEPPRTNDFEAKTDVRSPRIYDSRRVCC